MVSEIILRSRFKHSAMRKMPLTDPHLASGLDEEDIAVHGQSIMRLFPKDETPSSENWDRHSERPSNEQKEALSALTILFSALAKVDALNRNLWTKILSFWMPKGQLCGGQPQHSLSSPPILDYSQISKIMDCCAWHDDPACPKLVSEAHRMFCQEEHQPALIHLDTGISTTSSTHLKANATLLKSCVLRIAKDLPRALDLAEQVVATANLYHLQDLLSKAQLYRGLCLYEMGLYADAKACYIRAANINWFAREVTGLTALAEEKRRALPDGSTGKQLTPTFREIPLLTLAKGSGDVPKGS